MVINRKARGFTLVELLFVIVLMVVLMSLTAPLFSRTFHLMEQRTSADRLLALMELARSRAILEQIDYGVQFDVNKKRYWLVQRRYGELANEVTQVRETWGRTHSIPPHMIWRSEESMVFFHPDGTATPLSLEMMSAAGPSFVFHVDPILGKSSYLEKPS